jgi:lipid II:glycine glycyltransferase (peptidoglycan interpeptide bridge formation enzyme)
MQGDANHWNTRIAAHGGSFLQSWEWGDLQEKRGNRIHRLDGRGIFIALLIERKLPFGFSYLYAPRGPLFHESRFTKEQMAMFLDAVENIPVSGRKPFFLRIEPEAPDAPVLREALFDAGFQEGKSVQPQETLFIEIARADEELLTLMEHDTRYAIRVALRRGITLVRAKTVDEKKTAFEAFWDLFEETNRRHELHRYEKVYYESVAGLHGECHAEIFLANLNAVTLAAAIVVYFRDRATYLYAGSASGYGRFNAPTFLLWEIIRAARDNGYRTLDLWGISADDPKWAGITAFKRSLGGKEVRYLGAWDYRFDKFIHSLYKMYSAFRRN